MPDKKQKKPIPADFNPAALDFKQLLASVQSAGSAPKAKAELEAFQAKMKMKASPAQTQKSYQIRDEMLASREAQGKKGVPMTEAERQAFMKKILKDMGMPVDKK